MVAVDAKTAYCECTSIRHPLFSVSVKYVVTVTSHTLWRHDAIRHTRWWRILPYTAASHTALLRVGDSWNFGDKQIGVSCRIIASQCVCRGIGHCNRIRGTVFLCARRRIRKYMCGCLPDHLGVPYPRTPGRTRTLCRFEPTRNWSVLISTSWG